MVLDASNLGVIQTMRFDTKRLAALVLLALAGGVAQAGTIQGTVKFEGTAPALKPLAMDADPGCSKKHKEPVANEALVLGPGNTMANIFVRVTKGVPDKAYPAPATPVVIDQDGCRYKPHVVGMMAGQKIKFKNSDGLLHNVHALPKVNKEFNMAMPASRTEAEATFDKPEDMFVVKCDVHPWMGAYVAVMKHPFFDVTEKDGKFEIKDLPPGTYEIEAWHEKLKTKTTTVTIKGTEAQTADFTFSAPAK
jgi:plastocyanin